MPCGSTADALAQAIDITSPALEAMGISLDVIKTHISNAEKAIEERLLSSPTIRINGFDIDPTVTQDDCPTCSDMAQKNVSKAETLSDAAFDAPKAEGCCPSCDEPSDGASGSDIQTGPSILCRTWHWQGEIYQAAPIGKIVEAIMLAAMSSKASANSCCATKEDEPEYEFPANLKTFFSVENFGENACCGANG